MLTNDLKAWKNVTFAFSSSMGPPIKCPKWLAPPARKNSIRPVSTSGFPPVKIQPVRYAGIYSKNTHSVEKFSTLNLKDLWPDFFPCNVISSVHPCIHCCSVSLLTISLLICITAFQHFLIAFWSILRLIYWESSSSLTSFFSVPNWQRKFWTMDTIVALFCVQIAIVFSNSRHTKKAAKIVKRKLLESEYKVLQRTYI